MDRHGGGRIQAPEGDGRIPANIPVAEEELPAEIGFFYGVVVRDGCEPLRPDGYTHHGKVLEELAAQCPRTHQKHFQVLQLSLHALAKDGNLTVMPAALLVRSWTQPCCAVLL